MAKGKCMSRYVTNSSGSSSNVFSVPRRANKATHTHAQGWHQKLNITGPREKLHFWPKQMQKQHRHHLLQQMDASSPVEASHHDWRWNDSTSQAAAAGKARQWQGMLPPGCRQKLSIKLQLVPLAMLHTSNSNGGRKWEHQKRKRKQASKQASKTQIGPSFFEARLSLSFGTRKKVFRRSTHQTEAAKKLKNFSTTTKNAVKREEKTGRGGNEGQLTTKK